MIAYFDASSLATLILQDQGWQDLSGWIGRTSPVATFSDFAWGEVISAVSLRVRRGATDWAGGVATIADAQALTADRASISIEGIDIASATALVARFDLKLRLPDAIHVATAQRIGATLVTGDRRQAAAAASLRLPVYNHLTGDPRSE